MNALDPQPINYLAVLLAAVVGVGVRFFWYAPPMFQETWLGIIGLDKSDKEAIDNFKKETRSHPTYIFIGTFLSAAVMARFIDWLGATGVGAGVVVGFWGWLGFALPITINDVLFSGRESGHMWKLFLIQSTHSFFALLLMGGILGGWR